MTYELIKSKEIKEDKLAELPAELRKLLTNAKRKKFHFPSAEKTVKDVNILYLLDEKSHKNISLISSKFLTSGFTLNYLKVINEIIEKKYKVPQLTLDDFIDENKMRQVKQKITELEDEPIINWLKEECLEELKDIIDYVNIDNIDKLVKLGHIISLSEKELSNKERIQGIELYDMFYRYLDRTNNLKVAGIEPVICKIYFEPSESENKELRIDIKISP